jgi:hypothetical protein
MQQQNVGVGHEPNGTAGGPLLTNLLSLVAELRSTGLRVSLREEADAARVLAGASFLVTGELRDGLAAALVKDRRHRALFDHLFRIFFIAGAAEFAEPGTTLDGGQPVPGEAAPRMSDQELQASATEVLRFGDDVLAGFVARTAVARYVVFEPGRKVAGARYEFQVQDGLALDDLEDEETARARADAGSASAAQAAADRIEDNATGLRARIGAAVQDLLVADRGAAAVARTLRRPLPEDVIIAHASASQLTAIRAVLARAELRRRGRLDLPATVRASLATGGTPVDLRWRSRRPRRAKLWVLADMSGSVATFGAFGVALVSSLNGLFSGTRCFAFIENLQEVTDAFAGRADPLAAARQINQRTELVWSDGHSDYGRSLSQFRDLHAQQLSRRTSVLILGDARNNYRPAEAAALETIARAARHVYWLNPEPRHLWDTGDSIMSAYLPFLTAAGECQTVAQLAEFVSGLGEG